MRSYGKVVYVFGPLPILGFIIFVTKILGLFPLQSFQQWLHSQDWSAFIYNAKVRLLAGSENNKTSMLIPVLGLCRQGMLLHLEFLRGFPAAAGGPQQAEAQREERRHRPRHHHPTLPHHQRHPGGRHPRAARDYRAVQLHPFILW